MAKRFCTCSTTATSTSSPSASSASPPSAARSPKPTSNACRSVPSYPWLIVALGRPREVLYARIDARVDRMMAAGLEAELRRLTAAGLSWDLPAMQSVGYQEWAAYLRGEIDLDEVLRLIRHNTRRLVRSQDSWLRSLDQPVLALDLGEREVGSAEVDLVLEALGEQGVDPARRR